jgi:predicted nucleic acid-binding OB-fold protein
MINIYSKKCLKCHKRPFFNFKNEKNPIYCNIHKLKNMIDIKNKTCIYSDCMIRASFNFENEKKPIYCNIHKLHKMINVTKNKK